MADVSWAQTQLTSGNSVRRGSKSTVYLKVASGIVPWPITACFFASNDQLAGNGSYVFSIDDCAATDWELHT